MSTGPFYDVRHIDTFRDIIDSCAELYPNEPAFKLKNKESGEYYDILYPAFRDDVYALGTALYAKGYSGKKIAVMGHNCYEWALTYLAVTCGIGVIVPIDKELQFDDINAILEISETDILICDKAAYQKICEKKSALYTKLNFIIMENHDTDEDGNQGFGELLESGKRELAENSENHRDYMSVVINPEIMSVLIFTSGTTGLAKGVMLSQKNICFVIMSNSSVVDIHPGDRMLSVLPLHHTYECTLGFLETLYNGCCISYCEGLMHLMRNMEEVQPTVFVTVPLMMEKIHARIMKAIGEKKGGRFAFAAGKIMASVSSAVGIPANDVIFNEIRKNFGGELRLVIMGAAAIRSEVVADFKSFGITFYLGYGLTECAPLVCGNNDKLFTTDTVGNPLPGDEIKIINADSQGVGEILIKGPNVMLGYYKDEAETAEVLDSEHWFHTGDLGSYDEKKDILKINGRIKNVIVTKNGKNIYPEELEFRLNSNPLIAESLVIGSLDEDELDKDNVVVEAKIFPNIAAIKEKLKIQSPTLDDISKVINDVIKDINKKIPSYKNIKKINIRDSEFSKTTTAKIKRFEYMNENETKEENPLKEAENEEQKSD